MNKLWITLFKKHIKTLVFVENFLAQMWINHPLCKPNCAECGKLSTIFAAGQAADGRERPVLCARLCALFVLYARKSFLSVSLFFLKLQNNTNFSDLYKL